MLGGGTSSRRKLDGSGALTGELAGLLGGEDGSGGPTQVMLLGGWLWGASGAIDPPGFWS
jgi:hypothetical protein